MKRFLKWTGLLILGFIVLLIAIAIFAPSENQAETNQQPSPPVSQITLNQDNWHLAIAEARGEREAYKGASVNVAGRVFNVIGRDSNETQVQVFTDPDESEQNTLVVIPWNQEVEDGQYLIVQGKLSTYHSSRNLFGGEIYVPVIEAENIEVTDRIKAFPADIAIEPQDTLTQHGLSITIERIELTSTETRVFIKAQNNSQEKASLYAFSDDPVIVQGTNQIKLNSLFGEDIPEPDDTLLPGTATEGVIFFEALNPAERSIQLVWEQPRTDNYSLDFDNWEWSFSW